jgi:protein-disulfide isomerase
MAKKRRTRTTKVEPAPAEASQNRQVLMIAGITLAAIVIVALLAFLSARSDGDETTLDPVEGIETGITEEGYPYQGSPDAPVKFIEYSDYLCGHCKDFALEKEPKIVADYVATGQVQYIFHYYALQQTLLAEASHCAADQGHFWEYHRLLFENQDVITSGQIETLEDLEAMLADFAEQVGLDVPAFRECWSSHKHEQTIMNSIQSAQAVGVGGTPAFFIKDEFVVGNQPYDVFQQAIEEALAGGG